MIAATGHIVLLVGLVLGKFFPNGAAAPGEDFAGARSLAMGYASRAAAIGNDAIFLNPAGMVIVPRYSIDLSYLHRFKGNIAYPSLTIVDSRTSSVAAGLAYSFERAVDGSISNHHLYLALAYPLGKIAAIGGTFKYLHGDVSLLSIFNAFTLDLGVYVRPFGGLCLGVVGYNLIDRRDTTIDKFLPIMLGAGIGYTAQSFNVGFDFITNLSEAKQHKVKFRYQLGGEYIIAGVVPIRLGYTYDGETLTHRWSLGLGYAGDGWGLDIGYRQDAHEPPDRELAATLHFAM
jgi:hypothetical protein